MLFALAVPQTTDTTSKCHAVATSLKSLTWSQEPVVVTVTRTTQAAKNISQAVRDQTQQRQGRQVARTAGGMQRPGLRPPPSSNLAAATTTAATTGKK